MLFTLAVVGDGVAPGTKLKKKKKKQQQQQQGKRRAEEDEVSKGLCGDAEDTDAQPAAAPGTALEDTRSHSHPPTHAC